MPTQTSPSLLRTLRIELGLTQEELARALDVTASTVSRWEAGRVAPSGLAVAALRRLAAGLEPEAARVRAILRGGAEPERAASGRAGDRGPARDATEQWDGDLPPCWTR